MATHTVARGRACVLRLRRTALLAPFLLSAWLIPGAVQAAGPRSVDVAPLVPVGRLAGQARPVAAIPPGDSGTVEPPRVLFHGPRTDRVVALTFDDGYAPANVRLIFEELTREGVAATFFVNGAYLRWNPQLWRSIAAAGYPIGNHTVIHEDVRGRPPSQVMADLIRNARLVQQVTGRPMIPIFRPPYGSHDAASDAAAAAAGFPTIVLWDVSGGDANLRATDASVLANASAGLPGSIVLLHAGPSVTPRILPALIAGYRARGFTFVTVPQLLGIAAPEVGLPPGAGSSPPPDTGAAAAPTPPPVLPAGDDRASAPVSPGDAPGTPGGAAAMPSTGGSDAGQPLPATPEGPPAPPRGSSAGWGAAPPPREVAASAGTAAAQPLARDSAWARGPSGQGLVAGATVALLLALLVIGAIAGRRARRRV
jgi:peptidoglycan/xylan/chitin deacetylase (PgdA/CDA1 family)